MSQNPHFAELVAYSLPESQWIYLVEFKQTPQRTHRPPFKKEEELGESHYQLLLLLPDCDKGLIEKAYKNWKKLEKYENGKECQQSLLNRVAAYAVNWNISEEIRIGLNGTEDEQAKFKDKWIGKGLWQAGRRSGWWRFNEKETMDSLAYLKDDLRMSFHPDIVGKRLKPVKKRKRS